MSKWDDTELDTCVSSMCTCLTNSTIDPIQLKVSLVNDANADIEIRSSDKHRFNVYRKDLEAYSEGFVGPPGTNGKREVVELPETSEVLELLLQFMRKQRQPDIKEVPFHVLAGLAEAAEKYEVYSAMQPCHIYMRQSLSYLWRILNIDIGLQERIRFTTP